jgi:hypothetical protein
VKNDCTMEAAYDLATICQSWQLHGTRVPVSNDVCDMGDFGSHRYVENRNV